MSTITPLILVKTLSPKDFAALEKDLKPSNASALGFLGPEESVVTVCEHDSNFLASKRITFVQVADRLKSLMAKAYQIHSFNNLEHITTKVFCLENKFLFKMISAYRGYQHCPFEQYGKELCDIYDSAYNFAVKNISTGKTLKFAGLIPHLLANHEFCEGFRTPYRFDVVKAIDVLELLSGVDYKIPSIEEKIWVFRGSSSTNRVSLVRLKDNIRKHAFEIRDTDDKRMSAMFSYSEMHSSKEDEAKKIPHMYIFSEPLTKEVCDLSFRDIKPLKISGLFSFGKTYNMECFRAQTVTIPILHPDDKIFTSDEKTMKEVVLELCSL